MGEHRLPIKELASQIDRGEIRLPEMQRAYVWRQTQVRDLLDSIYRGYPSGTILLWSVNRDSETPTREFALEQKNIKHNHYKLLLDGQQRLTSLSAIIKGKEIDVRDRKKSIDILFNLKHPDKLEFATEVDEVSGDDEDADGEVDEDLIDATKEDLTSHFDKMTFVVHSEKLARLPHWISLQEFFTKNNDDGYFLQKAGIKELSDPLYNEYSKRLAQLRRIEDYAYDVDILTDDKLYEEVTEIFVRVNSKGTKLRSSDLALAQITAKWKNSLEIFQNFEKECKDAGFNFEIGTHIRNMVVIATGQCKFNIISSLTKEKLEEAWEISKGATEFAINFFKNNVGTESLALLSSSFLLISVGYYGYMNDYELTSEDSEKLKNWVLLANTKGHYSRGSTETILDKDLEIIKSGRNSAVENLLNTLKNQVGKFEIGASELEGRKSNSAYFRTIFMKFREMGATDWASKLNIKINNEGARHKIEFHHIFPKDVLKKKGIDEREKINDIANLAFIESKTNKKISNKAPIEYIKLFKNYEKLFSQQCIPYHKFDDDGNIVEKNYYLKVENYEEFLKERRRLIAESLNEFLNVEDISN